MNHIATMDFVADSEDVARILFSPLFISEGILSQKAFTLEQQNNETYISVLRPAVPSFKDDMEGRSNAIAYASGRARSKQD